MPRVEVATATGPGGSFRSEGVALWASNPARVLGSHHQLALGTDLSGLALSLDGHFGAPNGETRRRFTSCPFQPTE